MNSNKIGFGLWALALCLFAPVFLYAQAAHVSLGANVSSAALIEDTVTANVNDGAENFFKIEADHLPATVCYFPDTAFGPVPVLVSAIAEDTLDAMMISENCRMGWQWTLKEAGEEETVRYLYFSAHENNATAEIRPYVFSCPEIRTEAQPVTACDEYNWVEADTIIYTSGTYTHVFTVAHSCDSIVTMTVTINQSSNPTNINVTAYDKYVWHGMTVTKSGYAGAWEGTNAAGCDSVVNLFATIRHLNKDTMYQAVCSSQTPFMWHGQSYEASGTYSTDTILGPEEGKIYRDTLHTLVLTVNQAYAVDTVATLCGTSYTWRGQTYTSSGNYPFSGHTVTGCDSVVTLRLTLNSPSASEETRSEYGSYEWNGKTYTESGDYTYTTTNTVGCDSVATLHLTILTGTIAYDTVYFCTGMNTEHEEELDPLHIRRYLAYTYESPADWDYMEGVILAREHDRMQVDLQRAEQNLFGHYIGELTPVKSIAWSYRPDGATAYQALEVSSAPQWISTGTVAVTVRFVCGQLFTSDFATDIMTLNDGQTNGRKVLIDGQIVIIRNGNKYNLLGTKIE